jgi:hypothetical protein
VSGQLHGGQSRNGEEEIIIIIITIKHFETLYEFITCIFSEIVIFKYLSRTNVYKAAITERLSMGNIECNKGNFSGIFKY